MLAATWLQGFKLTEDLTRGILRRKKWTEMWEVKYLTLVFFSAFRFFHLLQKNDVIIHLGFIKNSVLV